MTVTSQPTGAPTSVELEVQRIRGLVQAHRFGEAVAAAGPLRTLFPENRDVLYLLALGQRHAGRIRDALDTLAALLDEGRSDQLAALLKTMARFHKYSFHNICLISSQCPTATRVAGFQTWRTMGRFVRKGEKGIAILAPIVGRRETESATDNARAIVGFRAAYVFDVDQTDGEPLPTPVEASGDPGVKTAALRTAILGQGIAIESVDDLGGALGTSSGGCIRLLNGLSPAMEFTTLVHEHAHELLHRADDRPASCDTRELEAEAVAFVVGGAVGLNTSAASRDYILLYRGDREALSGSLDRIQRAASIILKAVSVGG